MNNNFALINNKRTIKILLDIICISFLILFPHFVPLPFYSYAVICLLFIWLLLKKQKKTWEWIGLQKKRITAPGFLTGIGSGLLWVAIIQWGYIPFILHFFNPFVKSYTEYDFIKGHPLNLLITLVASWVIAGFYEEVAFRGYIQTTIRNWFGSSSSSSFWISGMLTSLLFGLYHIQQDSWGVLSAFLGGLYWTAILRKTKGNLWVVIISHGVYDTVTLLLIYVGWFGK
ncbi:lysostaphin resistance A-like protein [Flavitalea flava]